MMDVNKRNRIITASLAAAMTAAFLLGVYLPQRGKLKDIQSRTLAARTACETETLRAQEIPRLVDTVERMRAKFQDFDQRLPRRQELPEFLREISNACMGGGFDSQVIKPGSPRKGDLYNSLPITLNFDCSFADLVEMLDGMSSMARLNRVEALKAKPRRDGGDVLDVQLQVNIYFAKS